MGIVKYDNDTILEILRNLSEIDDAIASETNKEIKNEVGQKVAFMSRLLGNVGGRRMNRDNFTISCKDELYYIT